MQLTLPLSQMSILDKLQVMEQLWNDLASDVRSVPSPTWHESVLSSRAKEVVEGTATFVDWQQAKQQIRDAAK